VGAALCNGSAAGAALWAGSKLSIESALAESAPAESALAKSALAGWICNLCWFASIGSEESCAEASAEVSVGASAEASLSTGAAACAALRAGAGDCRASWFTAAV
jgi:hypothetical protein